MIRNCRQENNNQIWLFSTCLTSETSIPFKGKRSVFTSIPFTTYAIQYVYLEERLLYVTFHAPTVGATLSIKNPDLITWPVESKGGTGIASKAVPGTSFSPTNDPQTP